MPEDSTGPTLKQPIVTFTSGAYDSETTSEVAAVAADWLEEQALLPFIRVTSEKTLSALDLRPGERVLDVGCGTGVFLPSMATAVGETGAVIGYDHSARFLEQAKARLVVAGLDQTVTLYQGDAHRLPFADGAFDAAHTERVLMHLEDPDAALRELVRVVRPGGRIVSAEVFPKGAMIDNPDHELMALLSNELMGDLRNPWMGLELRRRFVAAGMTDVRFEIVPGDEDVLDPEEGQEIRRIGQELADAGKVDRERAKRLADAMFEASERGYHCGYAVMFIAAGRVPGRG